MTDWELVLTGLKITGIIVGCLWISWWLLLGSHVPGVKVSVSTQRKSYDTNYDVLIISVEVGNTGSFVLTFNEAAVFCRKIDPSLPICDPPEPKYGRPKNDPKIFDATDTFPGMRVELHSTKRWKDLNWNSKSKGEPLDGNLNLPAKDVAQLAACTLIPKEESWLLDARIAMGPFQQSLARLLLGFVWIRAFILRKTYGMMQGSACTITIRNSNGD